MSLEIKLPDLGDNIDSGTVVSIFVSVGDTIEKEQGLVELETDKAVIEVPAPEAGIVKKILVNNGDEVAVGQAIIELEYAGVSTEKEPENKPVEKAAPVPEAPVAAEKPAPKATKSETIAFKIPNMGDNVESGTVTSILIKVGDAVTVDQGMVELETDKAVIEVPSDVNGVVKAINLAEGDTVSVGQEIMVIEAQGTAAVTEPAAPVVPAFPEKVPDVEKPKLKEPVHTPAPKREEKGPRRIAPASPSVRRFAREIGLDIHDVPGTGPAGRISIEDVKAYSKLRHQQTSAGITPTGTVKAEPLPDFTKYGSVEVEKLNKLRQTSANHLTYCWSSIPHVTQFDKADITHVEKLRKASAKKAEAAGAKLTMTAILIKVIEKALQKFPEFNASIDMNHNEIIYKKYFNVGVAVDTPRGLLVPVIKNVDEKNIIEIAAELGEMSKKARDRKLTIDEMQGGNFSISNLGGIGGTGFTPIVNSPDVAILGVSRSEMEPKFIDGEFKPRLMMPLALSYDHRIIDGAAAARFLRWVCSVLEEPFNILLEG